MNTFWFVWNPAADIPRMKHATLQCARTEAERLARLNRGQHFVVLQSLCECFIDDVRFVEHVSDDDHPPF